jgi:carotenoid cleavage dioxygenase-like enzyme
MHRDNVQHLVIASDGKMSRITNITVADKPMMHDFALTEKYVILYDLPVTFSMDAASAGRQLPYTWNPAHEARAGLLRRDGSSVEVRWIGIDPCFVFHTLNAYDDGDRVVIDVCRYEGAYDVSMMTGRGPVTLDRWIVEPVAGKVIQQRLDDRFQEFPRVDNRVIGRPHRYGYCTAIGELRQAIVPDGGHFTDDGFANVLFKHDLTAGTVEARSFGRGAAAGEAVFVPASPDATEDDGYVMAFVHDSDRGATDLVILAAQDFTGEPVARVHLPARVPLGFHGNWIADR